MIQSIERAIMILEIIAKEGGSAPLNHIAKTLGIRDTTAHNILKTLSELGYVSRRADDVKYYLGNRILSLSRIAGDDTELYLRLRPTLEKITEITGETVHLGVPKGNGILYLNQKNCLPTPQINTSFQIQEKLDESAMGLIFLSYMPGIRNSIALPQNGSLVSQIEKILNYGYALDLENSKPGLNCVAVPWQEKNGEVLASVALSGSSTRLTHNKLSELAWIMRKELIKAQ